jgi:hypothetical protein
VNHFAMKAKTSEPCRILQRKNAMYEREIIFLQYTCIVESAHRKNAPAQPATEAA